MVVGIKGKFARRVCLTFCDEPSEGALKAKSERTPAPVRQTQPHCAQGPGSPGFAPRLDLGPCLQQEAEKAREGGMERVAPLSCMGIELSSTPSPRLNVEFGP